jgi:hypothetical protein
VDNWDALVIAIVLVVVGGIEVAIRGWPLDRSSQILLAFLFFVLALDVIYNRLRDISKKLEKLLDLFEKHFGE